MKNKDTLYAFAQKESTKVITKRVSQLLISLAFAGVKKCRHDDDDSVAESLMRGEITRLDS